MRNRIKVLLALWSLVALPASALECPASEAGLGRRDSGERIRFLWDRLQAEHVRARQWVLGWDLTLTALTVAPLAALPLQGKPLPLGIAPLNGRDLAFAALASAATIASIELIPVTSASPVPQPQGDGCEELQALEQLAQSRLLLEEADHSAWAHVRNALINTGAATLGLGVGLGRWRSAWIGAVSGTLIGELMLLTKPNRLADDLKDYRSGEWAKRSDPRLEWTLVPDTDAHQAGVLFMARF